MSSEARLKQFLKQLKYKHVDLAIRDLMPILNSYKSLTVEKHQSLLPATSVSREYVIIKGTIPVHYKGSTYNIPIIMYLLDTHPFNPPVVYLDPTPDMYAPESRHVDRQKRVYLPYLSEWKHPVSDSMSLVQVMCMIFSDSMPVYSKSAASQPQQSYSWQQPPVTQPSYPTGQSFYPQTNTGNNTSQNNLPYPVGPVPVPTTAHNTWQPPPPPQTNQISRDEIKASLVWAVEDKLKRRFREEYEQLSSELVSLKQTNAELASGKKQIQNILQNCETERKEVITRIQAVEEKRKEIEAALTKLRNTTMPPIDEVVTAPYPLYRQLMDSHAEDLAIDDAIYHLGDALGRNRISLDIYLRKVRELSSRQFKVRAIVAKCRLVAGLPSVTSQTPGH